MRKLLQRRRSDESGAILVLAIAGVVLALICAALAVDLGMLAQEKRNNQKVADLAALDAARNPATACARAQATATKNGFSGTLTCSDPIAVGMDVEPGNYVSGVFTPSSTGSQIRVKATSTVKHSFEPGSRTVTAYGIAGAVPRAGFYIGSSLATIDTARSTLLNRIIGRMITEPDADVSLALASWQGLAASNVQLEALRQQLVAQGFAAGTVSSMLNSNTMTLNGFFTAMANAMTGSDAATLAAKSALATLAANVTNTTTFKLGDIVKIGQGADNMALNSYVNAFQMVTSAAELANGSNFITVDSGITVPNVTSTQLKLKVIEPPKFYFGTVGGYVETSQIDLTVTPKLNVPISIAGLTSVVLNSDLPLNITGGGARGTLTAACAPSPDNMVVTADPKAYSASVSTTVTAAAKLLLVDVTVSVPTTGVTSSIDGGATDLGFAYPSQFPPPLGTTTTKHAGSQPIGLQSAVTFSQTTGVDATIKVTATGADAGLNANLIAVTPTLSALPAVLGNVDNNVLTPLLTALGLDIGSADVTAVAQQCGEPGLLG